jgi:hypothetical protein
MAGEDARWQWFVIRAYRDPAADDARRVVFEVADPKTRATAGRPTGVVLRAGGDLLVRYEPPQVKVPGFGRDDYVRKAAAVVRSLSE